MALIECSECKASISDRAAACPQCGAPLRAPVNNAIPVVVKKEPSSKAWIWIPVLLLGGFLLFGALAPKNISEARHFGQVCRQIAGFDELARLECDKQEARIRDGQDPTTPPVKTSFIPAPAQPPSSASNEEIVRNALYPPKKPQRTRTASHTPLTPGKAP